MAALEALPLVAAEETVVETAPGSMEVNHAQGSSEGL